MLIKFLPIKKMNLISSLFYCSLVFVLAGCGNLPDASSLDIQQMIINIAKIMPEVLQMLSALAYLIGFMLVFKGVYKLKEYGEMRTAMSSQISLWPPVITLIIGALMIYFVSAYEIGIQTLFGYSTPLSYLDSTDSADELVSAVVFIMQVVGVIAFIRGMLLLNSAGGHNAQPGTIGKGLAFIIGGILAINMYGTWVVIINTLTGV